MADAKPAWVDQWLSRLLRPEQALPVFAAERSDKQQHRRLLRLSIVFFAGLTGALNAVVFGIGLSKLAMVEIFKMTIGLPLGLAVVLYVFVYFVFVRGRHDYSERSWKFRASSEGLRVDCGDGRIYEAPWARWRYESYTYSVAKMRRGITGLDLSLDGEKIAIDLKRVNNDVALARAVVQQLVGQDKS